MKNKSLDNKKSSSLSPLIIITLILGSVLFVFAILFIESKNYKKTELKSLAMVAKAYSNSILAYRDFYANTILSRIHTDSINITHNYKNEKNALPIPATMTLDLITYLNDRESSVKLRLISEYPFPWRENRGINDFDKKTLNHFKNTSEETYFSLYKKDDEDIFEFAMPIKMQESCVACHNTHVDSPKIDWKIGDTRGVQVITLEPELITSYELIDRIYFIIAILIFFAFNISIIVWLLQKDKKSYNVIVKDKEKLSNALEEARVANEAKSEFLANMSHEIRTPLNAIIGFSELLTEANLNKSEKEQAKIIFKSGKSLLDIINEILDFSKIESGQFELFEEEECLSDLIDDVIKLFEVRAKEKSIVISYQSDETIPKSLVFDSIRLKQVISNLISNSIKFTPQDGHIWLLVKVIEKKQQSVKVYFEIKDNGIGIPKDKQSLVFEAFSQADGGISKKFGGTGLGLTIVSKIINLMGSNINLESKEKDGAKFFFEIDFKIGKDIENKKLIDKTDLLENLKGNILVAEDNPINVILLKELLSKSLLNIDFVSDGNEAIKSVYAKEYDLILMDVNMPNCDGVSATKQIREFEKTNNKKAVPIIALTANVIKGDREKYLEVGMDEHLGKPIDSEELNRVLYKYLA